MSLVKSKSRPCLILIGCLKYLLGVLYHESFGKHCHGIVTVCLWLKEPLTKGTFNMLFACKVAIILLLMENYYGVYVS